MPVAARGPVAPARALGDAASPSMTGSGASGSTRSDSIGRCTDTGEPCEYARLGAVVRLHGRHERAAQQPHAHLAEAAEEDEVLDEARQPVLALAAVRLDAHALRPDHRLDGARARRSSPCAARSEMSPTLSTQAVPS